MPLEWTEVWKYTNAGFPVYIVTPTDGTAGHIAISFPKIIVTTKSENITREKFYDSEAEVVQAGASIGKMQVKIAWKSDDLKEIFTNKAKAYLFLGHLCI